MKTIWQLREEEVARQESIKSEKERLKEKVLCVQIGFPKQMAEYMGITGYTMKLSELQKYFEDEFENYDGENMGTFTIKIFQRTNKWIENLPEADI